MGLDIRRRLESAAGARDSVRAHPDPGPDRAAAAARLKECVLRTEALVLWEVALRTAVAAAIAVRARLRREAYDSVALLAALARSGSREEPALAASIR
jgi:hypothetical protein